MQACAAVGQSKLMHTYERLFFGKKVVAQLLLSSDDFTSPVRYRNLQNAVAELLALGVVPIVNENDSVSVRELEGAFGDNDELSSLLARAVKADWLLLLTNVDGFLIPNGRKKPRLQRVVRKLTPALEAQCNGKSSLGTGGMISKLRAAKLASEGGVHVAIVNGRHPQGDHARDGTQDRNVFSAAKRVGQESADKKCQPQPARPFRRRKSCCAPVRRRRGWRCCLPRKRMHCCWRLPTAIEANEKSILEANREDMEKSGLDGAMRDRLLLTSARIRDMARGVREVAALPDPIGETLAEWTKSNGLRIRKVRVPLGVVGIIYESRPNVTVDTAVLALKTGNAIVLRGGKEAARSNQRLVEIITAVPGVPEGAIELLDSSTRQSVQELIKARGLVDVIIPRGGAGLITFVTENSAVPVIETGAGNCHIFVDESADFEMADRIVINAKTQRPSVCNAAEKLLVHERVAAEYVPRIVKKLIDAGVEVRGDGKVRSLAAGLQVGPAAEQDWYEEYLRLCMAVARGRDVDDAIAHINRYSTKHTDSIVTAR